MDGFQLSKAIRQFKQELKIKSPTHLPEETYRWPVIIAVSGAVEDEISTECQQVSIETCVPVWEDIWLVWNTFGFERDEIYRT